MPRSCLSAAGSALWREALFDSGSALDVTMLQNTSGWVFPSVHPQDRFALVAIRISGGSDPQVVLSGPFDSLASFEVSSERASFPTADVRTWTAGAALPWLPHRNSIHTFEKLRESRSLSSWEHDSRFRPVQGDLNATTHAAAFDPSGNWPVYKGASFNLWAPDTGVYFARIEETKAISTLQQRRLRQHRNARSAFSEFPDCVVQDAGSLPCLSPRIAFSDITNQSNTRTLIVALVPPRIVLTHKAPYLLRTRGDEKTEAYLLGVLSSIPLDWYARRFTEKTMTFEIVNGLPIPQAPSEDSRRLRIVAIAGRLAAKDARYTAWAEAVGVEIGSVSADEQWELESELDALVSALYRLNEGEVRHIYETFHTGWDYQARLDRVLAHFRDLT